MAAKKLDADVVKARRLAGLLTAHADKLEQSRESLKAAINHDLPVVLSAGGIEPYVDRLLEASRRVIRRLNDAWRGLDGNRQDTQSGQRRDSLLLACKSAAVILAHAQKVPAKMRRPGFEEDAVDLAVGLYADDVPDHAELVREHRALVAAVVRAQARLKGAPAVADAAEALFDALGMPASYSDAKRSRRRRGKPKAPKRAHKGGHRVSSDANRRRALKS
ncbi:MAG TPA: hypothetical protein VHB79_10300 [Polyangiaceae bacterium]|nr:hypothetical protein [Polyangiaceae bacterium]